MSEKSVNAARRKRTIYRRGRAGQVIIYLGKQLRSFVFQSDWKMLPMSAVIALLVAMVVRRRYFISMEGTLIGSFALTCVAIWNGCFNSIQAICRERPIIKREHRSGMHISSYVVSHMIYQALICATQTAISLFVCQKMGVRFPKTGLVTQSLILDIGISMFLISYASDMISLFVSSVSHSTTGAMTVMPFLLIFQLVFSGGLFSLPAWTEPFTYFTISNYGMNCISAQSDYNSRPLEAAWTALAKLEDDQLDYDFTYGRIADFLTNEENTAIAGLRSTKLNPSLTVGELVELLDSVPQVQEMLTRKPLDGMTMQDIYTTLLSVPEFAELLNQPLDIPGVTSIRSAIDLYAATPQGKEAMSKTISSELTYGQILDSLGINQMLEEHKDETVKFEKTVGEIIDLVVNTEAFKARREENLHVSIRIGDIYELFGKANLQKAVQEKTAAANYNPKYEHSVENVASKWYQLTFFILAFAFLSILSLEFIDKDKR